MDKIKLDIQKFAGGTINGTSTASNCSCRVVWSSTVLGATASEKANLNKSRVTAYMQVYKSGSSSSRGTFSGYIKINGTTLNISQYGTWKWGQWNTVQGSVTLDVPHNEDGTKSIVIIGDVDQSGTTMAGNYYASATVNLDKIPRNSILNPVDNVDLGGSASFELSITKNVSEYYHVLSILCYDENNSTFEVVKTIGGVENGDVYSFTNEELEEIYGYIPNNSVANLEFILTTFEDSTIQTQIGSTSQQFVVGNVTNANPIFSDFEYLDVNNTTTALTGNNQIIIKGYSEVKYIISNSNKAVAQKYASLISYGIKNNNGIENITTLTYPIERSYENYNQNNLQVIANDSRGLTTIVTKTPYIIDNYVLPSGNASAEREDGVGDYAILNFRGYYWNGNFGDGDNTITKAYYRAKQAGGNFGNWIEITNYVSCSNGIATINNLRIDNSGSLFTVGVGYTIELKLIDGISTSKQFNEVTGITATITDGMVLDSYYKDSNGYKFAINKIVDKNGTTLQVNGDISADNIDGDDITGTNGLFDVVKKNNVEVLVPYTLYSDSVGTNGTIALSETSANFSYIELYYYFNNNLGWGIHSVRIDNPNGKTALMQYMVDNNNHLYFCRDLAVISGASITRSGGVRWRIGTNDASTRTVVDEMYVYKVVGYK